MKHFSKGLLAAGLLALSACGGADEANTAANVAADDLYNVAPDDLTLDNGLGNDLGTVAVGNEADGNAADSSNSVDANSAGNSQ